MQFIIMEQLSTLNIQSNTTVEINLDFLVKILVYYGILGCRLPAGFRCRSGNYPNYLQLAGSYQVEKSE